MIHAAPCSVQNQTVLSSVRLSHLPPMSCLTRHNWEKGRMINKSNGHNQCSDTDRCSLVWPRHYYWQPPTRPHPHHTPNPDSPPSPSPPRPHCSLGEGERGGQGAVHNNDQKQSPIASLSISKKDVTRTGAQQYVLIGPDRMRGGGMIGWRWKGP